jgi:hypothetical protein
VILNIDTAWVVDGALAMVEDVNGKPSTRLISPSGLTRADLYAIRDNARDNGNTSVMFWAADALDERS